MNLRLLPRFIGLLVPSVLICTSDLRQACRYIALYDCSKSWTRANEDLAKLGVCG